MQIRTSFITLLAVSFCLGCSQAPRPDGFPELFPCEITITQDGKPLEGAIVRLMPESSLAWIVTGTTNANGVARIFTDRGDFLGVPAGTFKVCVTKTEVALPDAPKPPDTDAAGLMEWHALPRSTYRFVKQEFGNESQTPHSITISKGKNSETFDVGEAVRELVR